MNIPAAIAKLRRTQGVILLLTLAALYVVLPQLGVFHLSWRVLGTAELPKLLLAAGLTLATYLAAAANYCLLAVKSLRYGRTVLMQLASMFANRLLPAGIGGIGFNYAYLRKVKHSPAQAGSVVAANNTLGFAGHMLLIAAVLCLQPEQLSSLHLPHRLALNWVDITVVALILIGLVVGRRWRHRLAHGLYQVLRELGAYRHRPWRLSGALITSVGLTLANVLSLYCCALAFGVHISFVAVLLVFTLGVGLGTITPTPGGLGGVEAGLVGGLVAYHVSSTDALAVVLTYRFISYWLALILGAGAFLVAERRQYF